ncbi:hypothetical protein [Actinoplanes sp. NPDC049118]|uniref:hypothetical protein n=1 Tax=Actinoplanes sp. NPDC049118 TaxID=3155769 RepID=UPI0033C57AA3
MAGGGADWNAYNLPAIWSMIQPENACAGADRVLSWLNLATACRDQHRRLLAARADLAEVWPPESNASARVFMRQLDLLAASLDQTLTRAEDTRVGLQGVFDAIGAAQATIRPLAAERAVVSDDLIPRLLDHAEDGYDERARQAMREAEAAIGEHGTQIRAPALYLLQSDATVRADGLPEEAGPGASAGGGPAGGTLRAVPRPVAVPHDPPAPSAVPGPAPGPGPGLAGVAQAPPPPAAGAGGAALPPPVTPGAQVSGVAPPGLVIGAGLGLPSNAAAIGRAGAPGVAGGLGGPGAAARGSGVALRGASGARRPLPSGAVIGAAGPGGGIGRAAPVPALGGAGRGAGTGDGGGEAPAGAVDQRWGVPVGVAPVIAPDTAEPEHGPGPGVIGLDR